MNTLIYQSTLESKVANANFIISRAHGRIYEQRREWCHGHELKTNCSASFISEAIYYNSFRRKQAGFQKIVHQLARDILCKLGQGCTSTAPDTKFSRQRHARMDAHTHACSKHTFKGVRRQQQQMDNDDNNSNGTQEAMTKTVHSPPTHLHNRRHRSSFRRSRPPLSIATPDQARAEGKTKINVYIIR